jgi:hypothetical protein
MPTPTEKALTRAVLRTLAARPEQPFPLTGGYLQRRLRRLGHPVGEHKALTLVRWLRARQLIRPVGSYRGKQHGYRVTLYRTGRRFRSTSGFSVRRSRPVKPWWRHPLFGLHVCEFPSYYPKRLQKWKE